MTELLHLDEQLFHLINTTGKNAFFDWLLPLWRNKLTWIPLYLLLIGIIVFRMKKKGVVLLLLLGLTVAAADNISNRIIKKNVKRERPCRNENLRPAPNVLVHCGGGYSFTSNHAANHFAVAVFLLLTTGGIFGRRRLWFLPWAILVAYAQVYVGVHYPSDIIGGAVLGMSIAVLAKTVYEKILARYTL